MSDDVGTVATGVERLSPLSLSIVLCALGCVGIGILFAPCWGLSGIGFAMAISKIATFWPIQMYEVRRIFRAASATARPPEPQRAGAEFVK
jgi:hypothetical protein